jgi:thiamine biosynthesis protein ThiS
VPTINIQLNGEPREFAGETDLAELIDLLSLSSKQVAVELNNNVIRRADWPETIVHEGDRVEVVHFVGGG